MCQELLCQCLSRSQHFLGIEPCSGSDDGDRVPSVSLRVGTFSLEETAMLNETILAS